MVDLLPARSSMWRTMWWRSDILLCTDRLSRICMVRGWTGRAAVQPPGRAATPGGGAVPPPTASTSASIGAWNRSCTQQGSVSASTWQGFGSGLDPDSIRSVDSDPYSESGSGSRREKMTHKSRKKFRNLMFEVWMFEVWMFCFESWRILF